MAVYIKTNLTSLPCKCQVCRYKEVTDIQFRKVGSSKKCNATVPPLSLNEIDTFTERHPKCPLREHGGSEDFEGLHFVNPYTTRLIKSLKDLEKFVERFHEAQQAADAEE